MAAFRYRMLTLVLLAILLASQAAAKGDTPGVIISEGTADHR